MNNSQDTQKPKHLEIELGKKGVKYNVYTESGKVHSPRYESNTHTSVTPIYSTNQGHSYVRSISTSNHTTRTTYFFMEDEQGQQRDITLDDWGAAIAEGHWVSIIYAEFVHRKQKWRIPLGMKNYTTKTIAWNNKYINRLAVENYGSFRYKLIHGSYVPDSATTVQGLVLGGWIIAISLLLNFVGQDNSGFLFGFVIPAASLFMMFHPPRMVKARVQFIKDGLEDLFFKE